jgi:hypothetical protein
MRHGTATLLNHHRCCRFEATQHLRQGAQRVRARCVTAEVYPAATQFLCWVGKRTQER